MAERRLVRSERTPDANYDILETEAGPDEVYIDGYVGQSVGSGVIKTDLYSLSGATKEGDVLVEQRVLTVRLVMPSTNFIEMCAKTLASLKESEVFIRQMLDRHRSQILEPLSKIVTSEPKNEE